MAASKELSRFGACLLSDGLDALGVHDQVLSPTLALVSPPASGSFIGPARTLRFKTWAKADRFAPVPPEKRIAMLKKIESYVGAGDVVALSFVGPPPPYGIMGNLFAQLYKNLGAAAVVTDGYVRDIGEIIAMGLAVVAAGTCPLDGKGRIGLDAIGAPLSLGGIEIRDGDLVAGDADGTVVIPKSAADDPQFLRWLESAGDKERGTVELLRKGGRLSEAYARYGQL